MSVDVPVRLSINIAPASICIDACVLIVLQKKATGQQLMEQVNYHLDLIEKDYFGLQYSDPYSVPHWLDPTKVVKKQVKSKS